MPKNSHELRDAIHGFVRFDNDEKEIINSRPFQRLRDIHQLATTFLIYPGATHRRFEHSLGVMELAGRVFDIITHPSAVHPLIREMIPLPRAKKRRKCSLRLHSVGYFAEAAKGCV